MEEPGPVRELLRVAALCSDARLVEPDGEYGWWHALGDTTEGARLVAARKAGLDLAAEQAAAPRLGELPFDATRKLTTTLHRGEADQGVRQGLATGGAGPLHTGAGEDGTVIALDDATRGRDRGP